MCTKGWDVKAFQAAQQEKDKQIRLVLENILLELKRLHTAQAAQPRNLPDLLVSGRGGHWWRSISWTTEL
jgi:hypothetical protein